VGYGRPPGVAGAGLDAGVQVQQGVSDLGHPGAQAERSCGAAAPVASAPFGEVPVPCGKDPGGEAPAARPRGALWRGLLWRSPRRRAPLRPPGMARRQERRRRVVWTLEATVEKFGMSERQRV